MWPENCMVTLTYDKENLPEFPHSLEVEHHQDFMKALRHHYYPQKIRFFNAGEYGKPTPDNDFIARPHWHTILFNYYPTDLILYSSSERGDVYESETLDKIWGRGHARVTELSNNIAQYVAKYCIKKINGDKADEHYQKICPLTGETDNVRPEFSTMSRRPGIAKDWYEKYKSDVFPHDMVILKDGTRVKTPRYYDNLFKETNPDIHQEIKDARMEYGHLHKKDQSKKRLLERETVAKAKLKQLQERTI